MSEIAIYHQLELREAVPMALQAVSAVRAGRRSLTKVKTTVSEMMFSPYDLRLR